MCNRCLCIFTYVIYVYIKTYVDSSLAMIPAIGMYVPTYVCRYVRKGTATRTIYTHEETHFVKHSQTQTNVKTDIRTFLCQKFHLLFFQGRQNFPGTFSKSDPIPVSLAPAPQNHLVPILNELARQTAAHVDQFGALPTQLQHASVGIWL